MEDRSLRVRIRNRDGTIDDRHRVSILDDSDWTSEVGGLILDATQELVDNMRVDLTTRLEHEELASTVQDALRQAETPYDQATAQFQLAYVKSDIAFFDQDPQATWDVIASYESLLLDRIGHREEGPLRINIGVGYENLSRWLGRPDLFDKAADHWREAVRAYERFCLVEKALKARTLVSRYERWQVYQRAVAGLRVDLSHLIETRNIIVGTLSRVPDRISGWQCYNSNQERIYLDLLIAAVNGSASAYDIALCQLYTMRNHYWDIVAERGGLGNPWIMSVLLPGDEWQAETIWVHTGPPYAG